MWKFWWKNCLNLVYPLSCLVCKVRLDPLSDKPICSLCWSRIKAIWPPFCRVCGRHLPRPPEVRPKTSPVQSRVFVCWDCQRSSCFFRTRRSVCTYDGVIKECIHLLKYKGKLALVKPLSKLMIDFAGNFLDMANIDLILPVPLHRAKQQQRQFNQASLLAKPLTQTFSKQLVENLLLKTKAAAAQVNLARRERLRNVRDTFKVKHAQLLKNKNILLVDDVVTTAATANECARILSEAGAKRIDVFTLACSI